MAGQQLSANIGKQQGQEHQKALAIIFCLFLVLLYKQTVWDQYFHPSTPQVRIGEAPKSTAPTQTPAQESYDEPTVDPSLGAQNTPAAAEVTALPPPSVQPQGFPTDGQMKTAGIFSVETGTFKAGITLLGGRLTEMMLSQYKESLEKPDIKLNMIEHVERAPLPLGLYSGSANDSWVRYSIVSPLELKAPNAVLKLAPGESKEVVLEGILSDGRGVKKTLVFRGDGYTIGVKADLSAKAADSSRVSLEWTKLIPKDSPRILDPYEVTNYVWYDDQKALRQDVTKIPGDAVDLPSTRWVSLADKYFVSALLSPSELANGRVLRSGQLFRTRITGQETTLQADVFAGPKNLELLEKAGYEMKRNINFGRTALIAAPLASLLHFLYQILGNYGLAIVMLTIIVKLLLYPLTASSYKQMKAMQEIAPEMQKIKETITDKQQQQLAMMELYKKRNVNPLGGCLPMLLQMPVFFGLFSALQLSIELRHAPFAFWIHDLSAPERLMIGGMAIPVMVILFVLSMLIQQWTTPSTMDATQKRVMLVMPLVFGFMFSSMPAGLTLYWLTNNTISICQQMGLRKGGIKSAIGLTVSAAAAVFGLAFILVKISGHS